MEEAKKPGKAKRFLKRLAIASVIAMGYGLFYTHFDANLIKGLSQKKDYIVGIDFEAYNKKEKLGISIRNKDDKSTDDVANKEIENWSYIYSYTIAMYMSGAYANALGFTPYYGNIYSEEKKTIGERLGEGDETLEKIVQEIEKPNITIIRVRGDKSAYEYLKENDPLTFITKRMARNVTDYDYKVIIELEMPDDGDYKAHNERIAYIKKMNPKLRIATTLDKKEGYNEETGLWDPERSRKYWENSDIIILEDYFSNPSKLEKSIKDFKEATMGGKQVWVRVVVGNQRINERNIKDLNAEVEEYERVLEVVKNNADGCLVNDTNGIWLYSDNPYDKGERKNRTKQMYKKFRRIKIEKT